MKSAFIGRLGRLREKLVREHLDALVVTSLPNVRYLTGFSGSNAVVAVCASDVVLLTDFRYRTQAAQEVPAGVRVRIESASLWTGLWQELSEFSAQAVGFESAHITHRDFQRLLEQGDRYHWRPQIDSVEELRACKDEIEVESIRTAGAIAAAALKSTVACVRAGMTELDVCGLLERNLREEGSEAHPFAAIVACGARSALPHARASEAVVGNGDFLLLDFGAVYGGYCSDMTRTFVVGRANEKQKEIYEVVRAAQERARNGVRAGMRGREADAIAREWIEERGFGVEFGHGLGHGLGLEVHEAPRLSRVSEDSLSAGNVVTIEPGVYVPEWGGVRIEDDVLVTAAGSELLTEFPRELMELGE